ncbi:MAG TPA: T9SS type A sorting domain-containing protein [Bacteroidales bacterium]|nr:T9SS type A sorting domain-containing protein [Bacteroidales bacterium]HRZ77052.1 T9SS type A sorting domain-containing protein [Bacteroidales bacterium]
MRTLIILFLFLAALRPMAQTAVNFNCNDCNSVGHELFTELDAGKVVVLCWVMPCGACIGPSLTANNVVASFDSAHPGRVVMYVVDDYANTSCSSLNSWLAGTAIKNVTTFSSSTIKMSDYGSDGMPKIVVVAGNDHRVFFNANNTVNGFTLRDSIASALEHIALSTDDPEGSLMALQAWPNPAVEEVFLRFSLDQPSSVRLELADMQGRIQASSLYSAAQAGEQQTSLQLGTLSPGAYILRIYDGRGIHRALRLNVR